MEPLEDCRFGPQFIRGTIVTAALGSCTTDTAAAAIEAALLLL